MSKRRPYLWWDILNVWLPLVVLVSAPAILFAVWLVWR